MKRTKFAANSKQDTLTINSLLEGRARLASLMGQQTFGGDRDLYKSMGYPRELGYENFELSYKRHDIAKAIIKRPVEATWSGEVQVSEFGDSKDTEFEKEWDRMEKRLKLKATFSRLDKLTSLGRYGVLLLGFSDVKKIEDFSTPVASTKGGKKVELLYVKPLGEAAAKIHKLEGSPSSPRYGMPDQYNLTIKSVNVTTPGSSQTILVHHSRVIHVAWDCMENDYLGTPVLEVVFNRLMDLEKLVGGSAEMFWRGARPGYQAVVDKEYTLSTPQEKRMIEQLDEYENNLRRFFAQEGVELKALAPQVSDPKGHVEIQVQMISAVTGIPQRILLGSEKGELSSGQDSDMWKTTIQDRRQEQIEPSILRPFIDKMLEMELLPKPNTEDYMIKWSDLFAPSEKERAETGKIRATAVQSYLNNPMAVEVIPPDMFVEFMLGLTKEQLILANKMREQAISAEEIFNLENPEEEEVVAPEATPEIKK